MKIGFFKMIGLTDSTIQASCFSPAIICLAAAVAFFGTADAQAQDTTPPRASFEGIPQSHDGTPFEMAVVFTEEVTGFTASDFYGAIDFHPDYSPSSHRPLVSNLQKDANNNLRYAFTVTPRAPLGLSLFLSGPGYTDLAGNQAVNNITSNLIRYVEPSNAAPVADAGSDQTVQSGGRVLLDGGGSSDDDGTIEHYSWRLISGGSSSHDYTNGGFGHFTIRREIPVETVSPDTGDVTLVFELTVTDDDGATSTDTVAVTVKADRVGPIGMFESPPVSHDGKTPFTITIVFDEEARFIGRHLERGLVNVPETGQPNGDIPSLSNHRKDPNDRRRYTFTVTPGGSDDIRIGLRSGYTDWFGNQGGGLAVEIPYVGPNEPPVADAGSDQTVQSGGRVPLDGSGSLDNDGTIEHYSWRLISGGSSSHDYTNGGSGYSTIRSDIPVETVSPDTGDVTLVFELTVTDDDGATSTDTVAVTVKADRVGPIGMFESPPVSHDGKTPFTITIVFDEEARFIGRHLEPGLVNVPETGQPNGDIPSLSNHRKDPNDRRRYTFTVTPGGSDDIRIGLRSGYTDWFGNQGGGLAVEIPYVGPNEPPVADAGSDQTVQSGGRVPLDGSGSLDNDGTIEHYSWRLISGGSSSHDYTNGGSGYSTIRSDIPVETVSPDTGDVTLVFELTVTDDDGATSTDTVAVTVKADRVGPIGMFESPPVSHDGKTPFTITIVFDEEARFIGRHLEPGLVNVPETGQPNGDIPSLSNHRKDPNDRRRYTFTVTPGGSDDIRIGLRSGYTDWFGNQGGGLAVEIPYVGPNEPPVADAGSDQPVPSGGRVILDGSGSLDDDGTIEHYSWRLISGGSSSHDYTNGGSGYSTSRSDIPVETVPRGAADVTLVFELTVTDDDGATSTDTVTITVESPNAAPIANAGTNQIVESGARVTLDGRGSHDIDGDIVSYLWTRMGGTGDSGATLSNTNTVQPSFVADTVATGDQNVTHIFSLVVMDDEGMRSTANQVTITVEPTNLAPIADAGPQQEVAPGATVQLDGSRSRDPDGTIMSYSWTRTDGYGDGSVTLIDADTARPSFTAPTLEAGDRLDSHTFSLVVTDNDGKQSVESVSVVVAVYANNESPIAYTGPDQVVASGAKVQLDGSRSRDRDGTIVSYSWTRVGETGDSSVTLIGADTARPRFTAPTLEPGAPDVIYSFRLIVYDNIGRSSSGCCKDRVTVTVTARPIPVRLVADAGPNQWVDSGATTQLDGSDSSNGDGISYRWTRTGGTRGLNVTLIGADTARASFTADTLPPGGRDVVHYFKLTVTNSAGVASTDRVTVRVIANNARPIADAGPSQTVASGATVQLDGSRSWDSDGTIRSYNWWTTHPRARRDLTLIGWNIDADTALASFIAPTLESGAADVKYWFDLSVKDNGEKSSWHDHVSVTVTAPNKAPVAVAGDDQEVASGETVYLDGGGSSDQGGTIEKYLWERVDGTSSRINLFEPLDELPTNSVRGEEPRVSFTADTLSSGAVDVTHVFNLWVADNDGAWSVADQVTVTITAETTALASYADPGTDRLSAGGDVDILVSPSELTVQEGGPGSYRVKLSESPGQDVTVTAASSNEDVVLENPHLSFNADNWNEWQQVTLRAVADSDNANDVAQIRHSIDANAVTVGRPGIVSITVRDEDIILRPIGEYLETRATTLLRNQPKLISFLKLNGTTPDENNTLSLNATDDNLNLNGEFVRDGMWGAITGSYASNSSGDLNYALGSFGIHWKSSEHLLAGAMLQFDLADGDLGGRSGSIDGKGWLAGPYFAARHVTQPLFFEGRMLYGQSKQDFKFNDDVFEERNGSFSTTRWLAQLRMEGEIALSTPWSDGSRLIPYADARWTEDSAAAFTDSIGIRVPGQKVSIGEFELGSNIEVPISMAHGSMTFTGGLGVVFSNTDGDYVRSESRSRGRGEVGFSYSLDDNVQIDFEGYFDGIGTSQYESYGLSLSAVMKF